jgi:uncharacterized membrane protein YhhN
MRFIYIYIALIIGDLIAQALRPQFPFVEYIFKPALMISLLFYFNKQSILRGGNQDWWIVLALGFSCLGDIALMFEGGFLIGLGNFLIAHICYIVAFLKDCKGFIFTKRDRWAGILVILLYGIGLIGFLMPYLNEMKIPVIIYATTILTMLLTTLNRWKSVSWESFQWVFLGATLFVISDSMIAISQFVGKFPLSGILIMVTYAFGQYMIVQGYLKKRIAFR